MFKTTAYTICYLMGFLFLFGCQGIEQTKNSNTLYSKNKVQATEDINQQNNASLDAQTTHNTPNNTTRTVRNYKQYQQPALFNQTLDTTAVATPTQQPQTSNAVQKSIPKSSAPQKIDFQNASNYVLTHSHTLLAAQAGSRASRLQAEALDSMHQPTVFVTGAAGHYRVSTDLSTSQLRSRLQQYGDSLSTKIGGLAGQLPPNIGQLLGNLPSTDDLLNKVPSRVHLSKRDNFARGDIAALWPIYTGGRIDAIQKFAHGRADAKASEVISTKEELMTLLIQRYFSVQLATSLVTVRKKAQQAVKGHDHAAQRMLDVGLISKSERLQGSAALADAQFQLDKARDDLRLAKRALSTLLQKDTVTPTTPLFINHAKLPELSTFLQRAQSHYPAFATINAKEKQAKAMKSLSDAAWKPTVSAFGAHQIGGNKNWVAGLTARWTINSPVDRKKMQQASSAMIEQVNAVRKQAQNDVNLLVEKNWLMVKDAIKRFDSLAAEERLAKQVVSLQLSGFREGVNTIIELNDAQAKLTKTRTERMYAAYEYVIALSELLASTGDLEHFSDYSSHADMYMR